MHESNWNLVYDLLVCWLLLKVDETIFCLQQSALLFHDAAVSSLCSARFCHYQLVFFQIFVVFESSYGFILKNFFKEFYL